ncbi:MAG: quinol:cytochrome C oxidoreductase [Planctomycetota bacterium]|nr:quinol:cytochrome C oxidoreductase [Planctomycetota bacterium]
MNTIPATSNARLGPLATRLRTFALVVALVAAAAGLWLGHARGDGFQRFQHAWLLACAFFLTVSLGALFFVILQHLVRAGWSVVVRRLAELMAANVVVVALLLSPLVVLAAMGDGSLWPWADPAAAEHHPLIAKKAAFLNGQFFAIRCAVYFGAWILLSRWLLRRSRQQDEARDTLPTEALERRAPPAMVAFAVTISFASFDLLMSLSPEWYSTIFGVYVFAGSVIAFVATTILTLRFLQSRGILRGSVGVEHYHDLGKLLFAFTFFWGYIAFSQFMLIWYADIPEETHWFHVRFEGSWAYVSALLLFGHFVLPFAGLLSRHAKRNLGVLTFWAAWMLVMHATDLFWLIAPGVTHGGALVDVLDVLAFLAVGGAWTFGLALHAADRSLVPVGDPRLHESLAFENL